MRAFRQHIKTLKKQTGVAHNRHHLKMKSHGGTDEPDNISIVPKYQHEAFHSLFSNLTPPSIALVLNDKWISKDYKMICVPFDCDIVIVKK